jgi:hypothetical protein
MLAPPSLGGAFVLPITLSCLDHCPSPAQRVPSASSFYSGQSGERIIVAEEGFCSRYTGEQYSIKSRFEIEMENKSRASISIDIYYSTVQLCTIVNGT